MKYKVIETDCGYKIFKEGHTLPLPYLYASKQYAQQDCDEFNQYGAIAECCRYYTNRIAGNGELKRNEKSNDYKYHYEKWIAENYEKFK